MLNKKITLLIANAEIPEEEKIVYLREQLEKDAGLLKKQDADGHTLSYLICNIEQSSLQQLKNQPKLLNFLLSVALKNKDFALVELFAKTNADSITVVKDTFFSSNGRSYAWYLSYFAEMIKNEKEISPFQLLFLQEIINYKGRDLEEGKKTIDQITISGENLICYLAKRGAIEILKQIYTKFELNSWRDKDRDTFLHLVLKAGNQNTSLAFLNFIEEDLLSKQLTKQASITAEIPQEEIYLFLSGGDLSFELSFAQKHPELANKMVLTTFESVADFPPASCRYAALRNKGSLEKLGVRIIHGIDARRLHEKPECDHFKNKRLSRVYFCHPFPPGRSNQTAGLVRDFFKSVTQLQQPGDQVIIARMRDTSIRRVNKAGDKRGGWGYGFSSLPEKNKPFTHLLTKKHKFGATRYPGYRHITTGVTADSPVTEGGSIEYSFQKFNFECGYSSGIGTDSESDTETSGLTTELERRNRAGQTAVHVAIASGCDLVVIHRLLELGGKPDAIDALGRTALFCAIDFADEQKGLQIAALLVKHKANPNFISVVASLSTPLKYAEERKKVKILNLLQKPDIAEKIIAETIQQQLSTKIATADKDDLADLIAKTEACHLGATNATVGQNKSLPEGLSVYQKTIQHLYALGDDTTLATNGNDPSYWYSIRDVSVLLRQIRQHAFIYKKDENILYTVKAEGEDYEFNRENQQHLLLTNLYLVDFMHPEFFQQSFLSDIKVIAGKLEGQEANRNNKWQHGPRLIVIPILVGAHWQSVRITIDYETKKASILWDDPYGHGRFAKWIKDQIRPVLKEAINLFLELENGVQLVSDPDELDKPHNQQGNNNGVDCGPIMIANSYDYLNLNVSNAEFAAAITRYSIKNADSAEHATQISENRKKHVIASSEGASMMLPSTLDEQAITSSNILSAIISRTISVLSPEDVDLAFSFVYSQRLETGKTGDISDQEWDQAYQQLMLLKKQDLTNQQDIPVNTSSQLGLGTSFCLFPSSNQLVKKEEPLVPQVLGAQIDNFP